MGRLPILGIEFRNGNGNRIYFPWGLTLARGSVIVKMVVEIGAALAGRVSYLRGRQAG